MTAGHAARPALPLRLGTLPLWQRLLAAAGFGAAGAFGFAPFFQSWILALALLALVWLLQACRTQRDALLTGWAFGFGHFIAGLYWVTQGIVLFSADLAMFVPIVLVFLPALMGAYVALAGWASWRLWRRFALTGAARLAAFALCWSLGEWLRGHLFTGFPWNLAGYTWGFSDAVLQSTSVIGIYGLSLVTVLTLAAPAVLGDPVSRRHKAAVLTGAAAVLAVLWAGGAWRLHDARVAFHDDIVLRVVQPSIPQEHKWLRANREPNFRRHLDLSTAPVAPGTPAPTHIVWPETAAAFFLERMPAALAALAAVVPPDGAALVGAPRRSADPPMRLWNSTLVIDRRGRVIDHYDKAHLVPLGEYAPLRDYLPLVKIVWGATDYSPGPGRRTLRSAGLPPFSPLICYEVIFSGAVVDRRDRPAWLLNQTNDAWFGTSTGPHQHLLAVRVRAIEEGLPVVRAASTGISAFIDPYGRVLRRLGLHEVGTLTERLPRAIRGRTPFSIFSNYTYFAMLALVVVSLFFSILNERRYNQSSV